MFFELLGNRSTFQECAQSLALLLAAHLFHPVFVLSGVDHNHGTLAYVLAFDLVCHRQITDFVGELSQGFPVFSTVFPPAESKPIFHAVLACLGRGDALRVVHLRSV